ncbi:MAG: PAS domain-containing protein [Bdellovibrio sp.]|nr:PAS domain-containing protein [Bdellovibrio sp.]
MKTQLPDDEKALIEKVFKVVPNAIYVFDLVEQTMIWFNDRVLDQYGYTIEEIREMGQNYWALTMHPDDIPQLQKAKDSVATLRDGEVLSIEYRFKDRQGEYHWINDRITVFSRNGKGEAISILGAATNIDDRKAYEETLTKTIEKLNLSLSGAKMGTWEWDPVTQETIWDERMFQIHGIPFRPHINPLNEFHQAILKEDHEIARQAFSDALEKHHDVYCTYRVAYANSEIHHIRCYGKMKETLHGLRMYGVAWDSTVEVKTERQMEEAHAKMISTAKMAALGEMSGGIAHEINNPLTVIQARSFQLMQMVESGKFEPDKVKQAAESISRTADKIAKIIKSLRSFSREGTLDSFEVVPVKQMIEETLEFCKTRFYNHGVEIEVAPIDEDIEVECRLIQIEQVLLNLLNNSFDAVQESENKWIKVAVHENDDHIEIVISDSGPGIPENVREQIMLPFFTTKEVGKGTGLGLSISTGIMKSHHGELFLDTKAPHTSFVMRIPRLQEQ